MDMANAFSRQLARPAAPLDSGNALGSSDSVLQPAPLALGLPQQNDHETEIDRTTPECKRMKQEFKSFTVEIGRQNIIDDMRLVQFISSTVKRGSAALASNKRTECNDILRLALCGLMQKLCPDFATEQGVGIKDRQILDAIEKFPEFSQGMRDKYMEESRKRRDFIGNKEAARAKGASSSSSASDDDTSYLPYEYWENMSELQIGASTFNQLGRDILTAVKETKDNSNKNAKMLSRSIISMQAYLESRLDPQEPDCDYSGDSNIDFSAAGSPPARK
eukprot:g17383.t1